MDGATVAVYEHLPNGATDTRYVLINLPQANRAGGSTNCRIWEVVVQLDCTTLFAPGFVSSAPADALASLVCERLDGPRLSLPGGYQMGQATAETVQGLEDAFDNEEVDVHRYVRMRFQVYQNL